VSGGVFKRDMVRCPVGILNLKTLLSVLFLSSFNATLQLSAKFSVDSFHATDCHFRMRDTIRADNRILK